MTYVKLRVFFTFIVFLSSIMLPGTVLSESNVDACVDTNEEIFPEDTCLPDLNDPDEKIFSFLDRPQEFVSSGVESFAQTMDEFFSEDKVFYNSSGSYLKFTLDTNKDSNGDVHFNSDFSLKLRLPRTKEKMKLIVESNREQRPDDIIIKADNKNATADDKQYAAGIQATLGKEGGWEFKPSIGMHFNSDVNIFVKLRLNKKFKFEKWNADWTETAYWYRTTEDGLDSSFELNRQLSENVLFRSSTFVRWTNLTHYYDLSQTFSIYHTLSKRRAVSYYIGSYGISEPTVYATTYVIGANYRQNIHKNYLFFELIPQVVYQKANEFRSEFLLTFRIEMIFQK